MDYSEKIYYLTNIKESFYRIQIFIIIAQKYLGWWTNRK